MFIIMFVIAPTRNLFAVVQFRRMCVMVLIMSYAIRQINKDFELETITSKACCNALPSFKNLCSYTIIKTGLNITIATLPLLSLWLTWIYRVETCLFLHWRQFRTSPCYEKGCENHS
jgi:hypothetical protein